MAKPKFEETTMGLLKEDDGETPEVSEDKVPSSKSADKKKARKPKKVISRRGPKRKGRQTETGENKYLDSQFTTYLSNEAALAVDELRFKVRRLVPPDFRTKVSQSLIVDQIILSYFEEHDEKDMAEKIMDLLSSMEKPSGLGDFR